MPLKCEKIIISIVKSFDFIVCICVHMVFQAVFRHSIKSLRQDLFISLSWMPVISKVEEAAASAYVILLTYSATSLTSVKALSVL